MFLYLLLTIAAPRSNLRLDFSNVKCKSTNGLFSNYDLMNKKARNTDNISCLQNYIINYSAKEFFTKSFADFKCILKILSDLDDKKIFIFDDCEYKKIVFEKTLRKVTMNIFENLFINPDILDIRLILKFPTCNLILKDDNVLKKTFNFFVSSVFNLKNGESKSPFYEIIRDKNEDCLDFKLYDSISIAYCGIIDGLISHLKD